jgi:hypothetical protein
MQADLDPRGQGRTLMKADLDTRARSEGFIEREERAEVGFCEICVVEIFSVEIF